MNDREDHHIYPPPAGGREHTESPDCWCRPVMLPHGYTHEGDVWEHRDVPRAETAG